MYSLYALDLSYCVFDHDCIKRQQFLFVKNLSDTVANMLFYFISFILFNYTSQCTLNVWIP